VENVSRQKGEPKELDKITTRTLASKECEKMGGSYKEDKKRRVGNLRNPIIRAKREKKRKQERNQDQGWKRKGKNQISRAGCMDQIPYLQKSVIP